MTQTDEEIKKEIIDKLQNEWGVDNRDSDSFDKWVTELFVSKINTLQEEYKKELIEKIGELEKMCPYDETRCTEDDDIDKESLIINKERQRIINIIKQ